MFEETRPTKWKIPHPAAKGAFKEAHHGPQKVFICISSSVWADDDTRQQ